MASIFLVPLCNTETHDIYYNGKNMAINITPGH